RRQFLMSSAAGLAGVCGALRLNGRAFAATDGLPIPPVTPRRPLRVEHLGHVWTDDYAWLRNPNWFTAARSRQALLPEIAAHIDAENAYCEAMLSRRLQAELLAEMVARQPAQDGAPPEPDGEWAYYTRYAEGAQQPQFWRRPRRGGQDQLLFDAEKARAGRPFFRLASDTPDHSPDHRLLAFAVDVGGKDYYRIEVLDIATGQLVPSTIDNSFGFNAYAFSPDSQWLYWVMRNEHSWPTKVFRRPVRGGESVLVYEETDPIFYMSVARSASNRKLFIKLASEENSEVRLVDADPAQPTRPIEPRTPGLKYEVEDWGDDYVIRTNADGAFDYKLVLAAEATPSRAHWRDFVPHRPGRYITDMRAFRDHIARVEWVDACPQILTRDRAGADRMIGSSEPAYSVSIDAQSDYASTTLRYRYQSPATPPSWYDYDMTSGRRTLVLRQHVPHFDPARYEVRRLFAVAPDGASVPVTVLMRRGAALDGSAPLFLQGYGSYGFSTEAEFSIPNLSLVDRGWITALAHVRGGAERGERWRLAAVGTGKKVSITDFIACAETLAGKGYTAKGRIVSHSLSAGGIIIGGSINLRPDLWAGAIGQVPFVDELNSIFDETNPLHKAAVPVWGDVTQPGVFDYIASYSPYDNVHPQPYPAVMATAGLLDDRVGYWEATKWVAKLRACSSSGKPVMVRINMLAGHMGDAGRIQELEQSARFQTFAIEAVAGRWGQVV
ncbi:MAG: S9 family peptidase, partial [Caulobacteraceae bacterium]